MRKLKFLALAALSVLAFSCQKEQEEVTKDAISLSTTKIEVGKKACKASIEFNANNNWTASSGEASWIVLSETSGKAGDFKLDVEFAANDTYENRTGEITILCGQAKATVTVNQSLSEEFGVLINKEIGYEEQLLSVDVTANVEYAVDFDFLGEEPWIEQVENKAAPVTETLLFAILENAGNATRTAFITIGAGDNSLCYEIVQEGRGNTEVSAAAYASNRQKPYDEEAYVYTDFGQFMVGLTKTDGSNVTAMLVLNVAPKSDVDKEVLPAGEFVCDADGSHADRTFSIKPADESEPGFTCLLDEEGNQTEVLDGTITIASNDNIYTIKAELVDENGDTQIFKYEGEMPAIEDQAYGSKFTLEFKSDYETYYTTKANEWNTSIYFSEKPSEDDEFFVRYLGLQLWGNAGEKTAADFEEGTYTWAPVDEDGDIYGKKNAEPMTFWGSEYGNAVSATDTVNVAITGGTIKISEKTDTDFVAEYDLDLKFWKWNDDWSEQIEIGTMKYTATDSSALYIATDSGMRPHPDEDHEFKAVSGQYIGFWFGKDVFTAGSQFFWFGWNDGTVDGAYGIHLGVNVKTDWEYEVNYGGRFCSTPLPEGTYKFSYSKVDSCLCNIKTASYATTILNTYSGTKFWVREGEITVTDESVTFDLYAAPKTADGYGDALHFTGTLATTCMYWWDYSGKSKPEWNDDEDPFKPVTLSEGMISTNNPMLYVTYDFTPQGTWGADSGWLNRSIDDVPGAADERLAKWDTKANLWDNDAATSFHTNFDIYEADWSWAFREGALVPDNYIQIDLESAASAFNIFVKNDASGYCLAGKSCDLGGFNCEGVDFQVSKDGAEWTSVDGAPFDFPAASTKDDALGAECTWTNLASSALGSFSFVRVLPQNGLTTAGDYNQKAGQFGIAELKLWAAAAE